MEETQNENFGYVVYRGVLEEKIPVAIFSTIGHAEWLSAWIGSTYPFERVALSTVRDLEIDKYAGEIRAGLHPFNIHIFKDGGVFFDIDDPTCYVAEPEVVQDSSEMKAISGTFWAKELWDAQELADQFRLKMIDEGKL